MSTVLNPFTYIANPTTGRPVFNGQVYLGEPDTDPIQTVNQIPVRVINEAGVLVPIAQPIRTGPGGIALNQGNPAQLDVVETQYSITIQNSQGAQVYYSPRVDIFGTIGTVLEGITQFREFGTPEFITSAGNDGNPFSYELSARVVYDDGTGERLYESTAANNTSLPTVSDNWAVIDITGLTASLGPPIASLLMHSTDTAPDGYFALDGSVITNGVTDYPALAASGSQFFSMLGGDITLDDTVDFVRGQGSSVRDIGEFQDDAMRSFNLSNDNRDTAGDTVTDVYTGQIGVQYAAGSSASAFDSVIVRITPTTGLAALIPVNTNIDIENRSKSNTVLMCIYHGVLS